MQVQALTPSRCRDARRVLGLSQRQLSQESDKSLSYIKQFETGRFRPSNEFLSGLVEFFE